LAWWVEQFQQNERCPVPQGKDPGEAFQMGIDLEKWIKSRAAPALTIEASVIPAKAGIQEKNWVSDQARMSEGSDPLILSLSKDVRELLTLLRNNAGVKIINEPNRYTVLRNGKYVGGRINELVFKSPEVMEYIGNHPAAEIDGLNLVSWEHV
jgi:hypothetical protein